MFSGDGNLPLLELFVPFWLGCFIGAIYFTRRLLAPVVRTQISFYITDFWVTILCVSPVMALIGAAKEEADAIRGWAIPLLILIAISMIMGIIFARIFSLPREGEKMPRRFDQAQWVVLGAYFFGLVGLLATWLAFVTLASLVVVIFYFPGYCALAAVSSYVVWWLNRKPKGGS